MALKLIAAVVCGVLIGSCGAAADEMLWSIGARDGSYDEFAVARNYPAYPSKFGAGVSYTVGESGVGTDWPFIQPGPSDGWAGSTTHPQSIIFDLPDQPDGVYVLQVDLVDVQSGIAPTLQVRIDDKTQSFRLMRGASEGSLTDPAAGRRQTVRFYIPGSRLHAGSNTATLTVTAGSWVLYDCISFSRCDSPPPPVENLRLSCTPRLVSRDGAGGLDQLLLITMDCIDEHPSVRAEITGEGGLRAEHTFANTPAGRAELEMPVPEVSAPCKAHLKVYIGNETWEADGEIAPQKHWRVYLMPSSHLDIGYTGRQDRTMQTHRENLERAIGWCGKYPGFIWDLEGSLVAEDYLSKGANPKGLLELARQGRIGVMGFFGNELTGICSNEGLTRLVDFYDELRRRNGIESDCAMMTDVPTMVATIPMILAGHGIKYLSHGINPTRARGDQDLLNTPHYWQSPDGSRVLAWTTLGYGYVASITGYGNGTDLQPVADAVGKLLDGYCRRTDYPFDAILLHGGYGDNQSNWESIAAIPAAYNAKYAYPKLIFTKGPEFFEHIERNFAGKLKTIKGDGGVWWEDGAGSSARETAITRRAKESLLTVEKLACLCGPEFGKAIAGDLDDAWRNVLMYDEHTWGAAQSISEPESQATTEQWAIKQAFADKAVTLTDKLLDRASKQFVGNRGAGAGSVVVFNPSSWERSEYVSPAGDVGRSFFADKVPPMGYKVFPAPAKPPAGKLGSADVLDNRFYKIGFDKKTGAVSSIYDKELGRELVDSSAYGLGQYLYVTGSNERLLHCRPDLPMPDLAIESTSGPEFTRIGVPGKQVMRVACQAPMAETYITDIVLYEHIKRIDVNVTMDKTANLAKEAGYVAFPFAFADPKVRIELPDGVIRPEIDQIKGACRDWYAAQSFVTLSDDSAAVAWSAIDTPLLTLQDIVRGQWYDHIKIANGNVFAYVFNNYWFTNYKASQDGPLAFRFAITSARKISDIEAKRFGESVQSPMIARYVETGRGVKSGSRSFVRVLDGNAVVQAMKPARFASGTILRLREMGGRSGSVRVAIDGIPFKRAYLCNLAEDNLRPLPVNKGLIKVPMRALGLATVLLERG